MSADTIKQGEQSLVYSAKARKRMNTCGIIVLLALFGGINGLALLLIHCLAPDGRGPLAAVLGIGGFLLSVLLMFALLPSIGFYTTCRWRKPIQTKCENLYLVSLRDEAHVGFTPGDSFEMHEGDTAWDVGFLRSDPDRLNYYGDRSSFSLAASQIQGISINVNELFIWKLPWVFVAWQETPTSESHVFGLEMRDARSIKDLRRRTTAMQKKLEAWWQARKGSSTPTGNLLGLPTLPENVEPAANALPKEGCIAMLIGGLAIGFSRLIAESLTKNEFLRWVISVAIVVLVGYTSLTIRKLLAKRRAESS
ncbi:MAG TPA: hypothetical protein VFI02_09520 [Armatimonadota bacterium]|nr:hypothetical protein [Armatimonadota bacterium]